MINIKKFILITFLVLFVVFSSTLVGFYFIKPENSEFDANPNDMITNKIYPIVTETLDYTDEVDEIIITPNTTIQYNYKTDGVITKTLTEKASTSLVNLNQEQLENTLNDVKVSQFSPELVILEKSEKESLPSYIVGNNNGFVSIFYKDENDTITLYDQTRISIETLPTQDKKMLEKGITAKDDAELAKIIEDYTG